MLWAHVSPSMLAVNVMTASLMLLWLCNTQVVLTYVFLVSFKSWPDTILILMAPKLLWILVFCVQHARTDTAACMQGGHLKSPKISTSKGRGCALTTDMSCCNIFGFSMLQSKVLLSRYILPPPHWVQGKLCPGAQLSGAQGVQVIRAMPESKHSFPVDVFPKCMVWYGTDLGGGWDRVVLIIRVPAIINSTFMAW